MTEQATRIRKPRRMAREQKGKKSGSSEITSTFIVAKPSTRVSLVEGLLLRTEGASLEDLCEAAGWQQRTCRAFVTGLRRKGREVERSKREDGTTIYHLAPIQKVG